MNFYSLHSHSETSATIAVTKVLHRNRIRNFIPYKYSYDRAIKIWNRIVGEKLTHILDLAVEFFGGNVLISTSHLKIFSKAVYYLPSKQEL